MSQAESNTYIHTQFGLQLESYFLIRLNLGFVSGPPDMKILQIAQQRMLFDFDFSRHHTDKHRYRVSLKLRVDEVDANYKELGKNVDAEIVGFFCADPTQDQSEIEHYVLLNGISALYGMLRGIVATSTGPFPGGGLVLPLVMAQQIFDAKNNRLQTNLFGRMAPIAPIENAPRQQSIIVTS